MSQVKEQSADYQLTDLAPVIKAADADKILLEGLPVWLSAQTRKSAGRGRSANNTLQYGVQKLRELILELAVRGKLVPQDSNDEPASILLEKVAEEKARLVKEGKIKKQKTPTASNLSEDTFSLPMNWKWAFLPDISSYAPGKTPPTKNAKFWGDENGIPWVSIADMTQFGVISNTSKTVTQAAKDEVFKAEPVKAGAILMSFKLTVGKVSINEIPTFHNEAIISIFPFSGVDRSYLFKVLPMRAMTGNSKKAIKGNTLNAESIAAIKIPIPPKAEQHRIVKKVDELMALCDQLEQQQTDAVQAHDTLVKVLLDMLTQSENAEDFQQNWHRIAEHFDTLFTTESSIDQLKQTLLQLAVMGKLVPQDPSDEPASILLEKITKEKAQQVKEGKIKKQKELAATTNDEIPFSVPNGWKWAKWNDFSEWMTYGFTRPMPHVKSGPLIITAKNVKYGYLDLTTADFTTEEAYTNLNPKDKPKVGDILITKDGSIGRATVVSLESDFCINQSVAVIWMRSCPFNRNFLVNAIHSPYLQGLIWEAAAGAAIKHISITKFIDFLIPIPPLAEQHRIVKKVDELMALCDQLKDRLNHAQTLQQQLADAVVETTI